MQDPCGTTCSMMRPRLCSSDALHGHLTVPALPQLHLCLLFRTPIYSYQTATQRAFASMRTEDLLSRRRYQLSCTAGTAAGCPLLEPMLALFLCRVHAGGACGPVQDHRRGAGYGCYIRVCQGKMEGASLGAACHKGAALLLSCPQQIPLFREEGHTAQPCQLDMPCTGSGPPSERLGLL